MEKFRLVCEICGKDRAINLWQPFESAYFFEPNIKNESIEDSVACCQNCKSRIYKMLRDDNEVFSGCVSLVAIKHIIRGEFRL